MSFGLFFGIPLGIAGTLAVFMSFVDCWRLHASCFNLRTSRATNGIDTYRSRLVCFAGGRDVPTREAPLM